MKTIGQTNDGGYIVEMSSYEHRALERLATAVEDKTLEELQYNPEKLGVRFGLKDTFDAINAFAMARYRVNEIRALADEFERALQGTDSQA